MPDGPLYDVAVVGFGAVGNALAVLAAQAGRRVVVLERWPHPYRLPRAVHFDHEAGRILAACGIGADLETITEPGDVYEWRNGQGATLLRFGRSGPGFSGWPQSSMFHQPALEELLAARAEACPTLDLRRGAEVTGLDQDDEEVTVHVGDRGGEGSQVRARYAVGCDGAASTVRHLVGSPVCDLGFSHDWLIVDVVLHDDRVFDPINVQICDPARPSTAVSGGPGRRRWEFMRLPSEDVDDLAGEAAAWRLLAPWNVTPDHATLERHAVYTFQARYAQRWRTGRVLLAGDAAHQMPPFAGQGLCSGLGDAANLAWKLNLVLGGGAGDDLLDTYQGERLPHVQMVTDFSMELGHVICLPDRERAAERDEAMIAAFDPAVLTPTPELPGLSGGLVHSGSPAGGQLFIQGHVTTEGRRLLFDDAVGVGWRLVARAATDVRLGDDVAAWFASLGGRVVTVGPGGDLGDPDGTYGAWLADHDVRAALQRPDFHLYGTAGEAGEASRLVADLRAALADLS
ncbi:MAG: bifunctional 3-(3-hydroxy-phenyl)propionate/3-hydroxycinnamic acid hydroxylase [Actinomycetota bacterium]|nr:bifunctional 3-(3-hydroxy-phenyl)propionate/3-hydroxycinnamic acid hydroxylase [Actinomycetota bacterium]